MNAHTDRAAGALPPNAAEHRPFSFLADRLQHDPNARFAEAVLDITQGITVCLSIVHSSNMTRSMNRENPDATRMPIVNTVDTAQLLRMAAASAELIARQAERHIEWMNEYAGKNGGAA